jgi:hypothetical protein
MTWPPTTDDLRTLKEMAIAIFAAALGGYVRARRNPAPLTRDRVTVVAAESVLCGFLAFGVSSWLKLGDSSTSYAIAGALGLIGTAFISDLIVKIVERKADAAAPPSHPPARPDPPDAR